MNNLEKLSKKERTIFNGLSSDHAEKFTKYFFTNPNARAVIPILRHQTLELFTPWTDRYVFPIGVQYNIDIYSGCDFFCKYCYVRNYKRKYIVPPRLSKNSFQKKLKNDIEKAQELNLPPIPLQLCNSSELFQPNREKEFGDTLFTLKLIQENRNLFSSITILTTNPYYPAKRPEYCDLLQGIDIEVTCSLWNKDAQQEIEPNAPTAKNRFTGIKSLQNSGVNVSAIRVDPIFPRPPIVPDSIFTKYDITPPQTEDDLNHIFSCAADLGIHKIISSVLKIPGGGFRDEKFLSKWRPLYTDCKGFWKAKTVQLGNDTTQELFDHTKDLAAQHGLDLVHCMYNSKTKK